MNKPLSSWLRNLFLAHWIISALFGVALFLVPGRTLTILGWVPEWVQLPESELSVPGNTFVDAILTRVLGAALLALAWSSFQGWRARQRGEVENLVQAEIVFCVLAALAFIAGPVLMARVLPVSGYIIVVVLLAFGAGWGAALRQK